MSDDQTERELIDHYDAITLKFELARSTASSIGELLASAGNRIEEVNINDVGQSTVAAVENMVSAFEEMRNLYDTEHRAL